MSFQYTYLLAYIQLSIGWLVELLSQYLLVGTKTEEQHNCNHTHQSSNHYLDISFIKPPPFREKDTQN